MPFTDLPAVLKPKEVASYLRVRPETVYEDIHGWAAERD
jgi:hypothetical protein